MTAYLPRCQTVGTKQVIAWLDFDILILFGTDLTKLESRSHFTVDLILLLCDADVILFRFLNGSTEVRIDVPAVWVHVTAS